LLDLRRIGLPRPGLHTSKLKIQGGDARAGFVGSTFWRNALSYVPKLAQTVRLIVLAYPEDAV
jgi:hypothetical protein